MLFSKLMRWLGIAVGVYNFGRIGETVPNPLAAPSIGKEVSLTEVFDVFVVFVVLA